MKARSSLWPRPPCFRVSDGLAGSYNQTPMTHIRSCSQPVSASVQVDDDVLVEVGMGVGPVGFSAEQQDQLWGMWRGGESLRTMERSLAVSLPRIQRFLRQTGGIRPLSQRRREGHLAAGEREEISRGIAAGLSGRVIADRLGRSPSTVSREIDRSSVARRRPICGRWCGSRRPVRGGAMTREYACRATGAC